MLVHQNRPVLMVIKNYVEVVEDLIRPFEDVFKKHFDDRIKELTLVTELKKMILF